MKIKIFSPRWLLLVLCAVLVFTLPGQAAGLRAASTGPVGELLGPEGSGAFGAQVVILANGNFVVTDPGYDSAASADVGAVYLYNGQTLELISILTGSHTNDKVGTNPPLALSNGNFVIYSPFWDRDTTADAGAVTWCSGTEGCKGEVSPLNSLVGSQAYDWVAEKGVTALDSGNYVVFSPWWNNGAKVDSGALTWCNGAAGCQGEVSPANSLVGSSVYDQIGRYGLTQLSHGNYVALNPNWDNGATIDAGATTWCLDGQPCLGTISPANSLVGRALSITSLPNGHYVVPSTLGVTWCNGQTGCSGQVEAGNSLVDGPQLPVGTGGQGDSVRSTSVTVLANGNYVVRNPYWDRGDLADAGAVTWCSGTLGCQGAITLTNSVVGSQAFDQVGQAGITALTNGNYVISSPYWNYSLGAVTWCDGTSGCVGPVDASNSLIGGNRNDNAGLSGVTPLANGNYVVNSSRWQNGPSFVGGAITWCDGAVGCRGAISIDNSLIGIRSASIGYIFESQVTPLANGHYVVETVWYDSLKGNLQSAVTWCNGSGGCAGLVSPDNSMFSSSEDSSVLTSIYPLPNGNYIIMAFLGDYYYSRVSSIKWCDGAARCSGTLDETGNLLISSQSGQITVLPNSNYVIRSSQGVIWCSGAAGCAVKTVSRFNSLQNPLGSRDMAGMVGETSRFRSQLFPDDNGVLALKNGNYLVLSSYWGVYPILGAGAVTPADGTTGQTTGYIDATNSLVGKTSHPYSEGATLIVDYDEANSRLVVGFPDENRVAVFQGIVNMTYHYLPLIQKPVE